MASASAAAAAAHASASFLGTRQREEGPLESPATAKAYLARAITQLSDGVEESGGKSRRVGDGGASSSVNVIIQTVTQILTRYPNLMDETERKKELCDIHASLKDLPASSDSQEFKVFDFVVKHPSIEFVPESGENVRMLSTTLVFKSKTFQDRIQDLPPEQEDLATEQVPMSESDLRLIRDDLKGVQDDQRRYLETLFSMLYFSHKYGLPEKKIDEYRRDALMVVSRVEKLLSRDIELIVRMLNTSFILDDQELSNKLYSLVAKVFIAFSVEGTYPGFTTIYEKLKESEKPLQLDFADSWGSSNERPSDLTLYLLRGLPVQKLDLSYCSNFTMEGLRFLSQIEGLKELSLPQRLATDQAVPILESLKLDSLRVPGSSRFSEASRARLSTILKP